jgi:hypothetical protein
MGFLRFRRSIKIGPGIRWNIGKKSTSFSIGPRGLKLTAGSRGVRTTVGIPGTGISYTSELGRHHGHHTAQPLDPATSSTPQDRRVGALAVTVLMGVITVAAFALSAPVTGAVCGLLALLAFSTRGPRSGPNA